MKRRPRWQRDPEGMRKRILDAAAAEFARHGYGGARIDRIAWPTLLITVAHARQGRKDPCPAIDASFRLQAGEHNRRVKRSASTLLVRYAFT